MEGGTVNALPMNNVLLPEGHCAHCKHVPALPPPHPERYWLVAQSLQKEQEYPDELLPSHPEDWYFPAVHEPHAVEHSMLEEPEQ